MSAAFLGEFLTVWKFSPCMWLLNNNPLTLQASVIPKTKYNHIYEIQHFTAVSLHTLD